MRTYSFGVCLLLFVIQKVVSQINTENVNYARELPNQILRENNFLNSVSTTRNTEGDTKDISSREKRVLNCKTETYEGDFTVLKNGVVFVPERNESYHPNEFEIRNGKLILCSSRKSPVNKSVVTILIKKCKKRIYGPHEFEVLSNGSVLLSGEILINDSYNLNGNNLEICSNNRYNRTVYEPAELKKDSNSEPYLVLFYVSLPGTIISVIALLVHLMIFFLTSSARNLPKYNLTSLSVAFLLAYFFDLIGRSSTISKTSCVISSVLELYFFLAGIYWMNAMAFDVMRDLKLAVPKLITCPNNKKKKRINLYLVYSIYAWGMPLILAITAIVVDNSETTSAALKPGFGEHKFCWFTNETANIVFFVIPVFLLLVINGIFFGMSARVLDKKTMVEDLDFEHAEIRRNFGQYAKLGCITGITWFIGIAAIIYKKKAIYIAFDILSSLEGLFIFLIFSCSKEVWNQLKEIKHH